MGNGQDRKPPDRRENQQYQRPKVAVGPVQPSGKPGGSTLTARLDEERRERARRAARRDSASAAAQTSEEESAPATDSDRRPDAADIRHTQARVNASCDAVFGQMIHGHAPAHDEAEPVQHEEEAPEVGEPMQREGAPDTAAA